LPEKLKASGRNRRCQIPPISEVTEDRGRRHVGDLGACPRRNGFWTMLTQQAQTRFYKGGPEVPVMIGALLAGSLGHSILQM
jgi:hypothetical protein